MGCYHVRRESPKILNRAAKIAKVLRSKTCGRLYLEDTLLMRLAQDLKDVAAALRPRIQQAHAVLRQRHLPPQRDLPPTAQLGLRDRVGRGPTRARGHHRRARPREANSCAPAPRSCRGDGASRPHWVTPPLAYMRTFPARLTERLATPPELRTADASADGIPSTSVLDRETNRVRRGSRDRACLRPAGHTTGHG